MIRRSIAILALLCGASVFAQNRDIKVSDLTLEEKIALLGTDFGIDRLGVPHGGHSEGLHGIAYGGPSNWGSKDPRPTTMFPQAYGLGETWDVDLIRKVAEQEAYELRYYFQSNEKKGALVMRAPNADLGRDPRWGRTEECFGEDPYLVSRMTVAFVKGLQGDDPEHWCAGSLMKHFLANSNECNRESSSSEIDERLFREYYGYGFYKGITEGGSRAYMAAYNAVNGIPMTISPLLREVTVAEWGNDGIICTDGGAFKLLMEAHNAYSDEGEAAAACLKAGITQFLDVFKEAVNSALDKGLLTEADIDEAIERNFTVAGKLGLLGPAENDPYYHIGRDGAPEPWLQEEARAFAREVTAKSVVLLKNDRSMLPLKPGNLKKIAVIGPHAGEVLQDWYGGNSPYQVSILEGIRNAVGEDVEVTFVLTNHADSAYVAAKEADVAVVVVGNHPTCNNVGWARSYVDSDGMEATDRQSLTLAQEDLVKIVYGANRNTVMVLLSSFPYAINWSEENVPAIVHVTHGSQELGNGLADVLFGKVNPAGRLTQTWPKSILDLPPMMDYDITHGRTYMYSKAKPLYEFGYGLSYTSFKYSGMKVKPAEDGGFDVEFKVKNTGNVDGEEVAQLYLQFPGSKVTRPERALKGFRRVIIKAGETVKVTMHVTKEDLSYWNVEEHAFTTERGRLKFLIGASSKDIRLKRSKLNRN